MPSTLENFIGNTPLVESKNLNANPNVKLLFKLEGHNPGGSVKDRAAYFMISEAMKRGDITKDTKLIEATSGNTGIALAMIASIYGLDIELVMPENSTIERVKTMKAYGAKVTLTPESVGIEGARDYAIDKVANHGYYSFNQFANDDNWRAHYYTTGPEIWNDTDGKITHFVSSMGTTGTIMGTSTYLKEKNPAIQIIGLQPADGAQITGIRRWPKEYMPSIFDDSRVDQVIDMDQKTAEDTTIMLAREEGIFCGVSSGGAVAGALSLSAALNNAVIVAIVCDRGDR